MNIIIRQIIRIKYIEYIFLSIILLFGFMLRLYKIDNPIADWHSFRQADTASVARTYVERGIDLLDPRYHDISTIQSGLFNPGGYRLVEFPLYNALVASLEINMPFLTLEIWARLVSILSATISAFVLFLLGRKYIGVFGGLFAALFFLVIPYNIFFTRVILPEPTATVFGLMSLLFFVSFDESDKKSFLYLSGIFLSLGILIKPFVAFYATPMVLLVFKKYSIKKLFFSFNILFPFIVFSLMVLVPFFAWRHLIGKHPEGVPFFWWVFNGDGIRFRPSFWRWIFGERLGALILGTWGLIPFAFGLIKSDKKIFINTFLLGMFLYVCTVATANVRHDYYQTITIPAVSLVLANGANYMWGLERRVLVRTLLLFSVFIMLITGYERIKEFYKINHPEIIAAGVEVDKVVPKNALVIAPYNGDTAFLYQTKRWGWPYVDRPIQEMIDEGAQYYVSVNYDAQTQEFMQKYPVLEKNEKFVILKLQ